MGSTHDYTANFFNWKSWIDLSVLNQITILDQKYELSFIDSNEVNRELIDFII